MTVEHSSIDHDKKRLLEIGERIGQILVELPAPTVEPRVNTVNFPHVLALTGKTKWEISPYTEAQTMNQKWRVESGNNLLVQPEDYGVRVSQLRVVSGVPKLDYLIKNIPNFPTLAISKQAYDATITKMSPDQVVEFLGILEPLRISLVIVWLRYLSGTEEVFESLS
jgi:hypothetical protein